MPSPGPPAVSSPTPPPTTEKWGLRVVGITDRLSGVTEESVLYDESTPQNKVWEFIIFKDEMQVPADYPGLIQRYVLATLFYVTGGEDWFECESRSDGEGGNVTDVEEEERCGDDNQFYHYMAPVNECLWYGVECTRTSGIVRSIELGNSFRGTIPDQLVQKATQLQILDLSDNFFEGTITALFSQLTSLRTFNVQSNQLSGIIPNGRISNDHSSQISNRHARSSPNSVTASHTG